jgi:hypothetical protein
VSRKLGEQLRSSRSASARRAALLAGRPCPHTLHVGVHGELETIDPDRIRPADGARWFEVAALAGEERARSIDAFFMRT